MPILGVGLQTEKLGREDSRALSNFPGLGRQNRIQGYEVALRDQDTEAKEDTKNHPTLSNAVSSVSGRRLQHENTYE